ncbi:Nudix hydrolase 15, mitochondrial [Aspergillus nanangensis]|uniref:Nudix hydrolase 15, mitochondrial n=1 Tax=Aspergillus nanangensis TaxID=2582783 RepID=A0AAD4GNE3_ASPNN|nr:Nudix hydrolase 15, mitochondrial [Aspergillus nanangensis]
MTPRLGVAVFVFNDRGEFILGKRQGSHGSGTWALPGGHLEFGESFEGCASREVLEETNLTVHNIKYLTATNDVMEAENKHYVTIFVGCHLADQSQQPQIMEPDKCAKWEWASLDKVRSDVKAHLAAEEDGTLNDFQGRRMFIPVLNLFTQRGDLLPSLLPSRRVLSFIYHILPRFFRTE